MNRTDAILLIAAAGLAIAIAAFSLSYLPREMTKELCEDSDGFWNECGSLCAGKPPGTACPAVCVPVCECRSRYQCPPGYYCSQHLPGEKGACRPAV